MHMVLFRTIKFTLSPTYLNGYIDVGDGCWRPNVLVTSLIEQVISYGPYDMAHIAPSELSSKVNSLQGSKCSVVYVRH